MLDLHEVLGSGYACAVPRPIQFLAEDELVVLAGPTNRCFEDVSQLELVAFSLEGKVLARRSWTSTDSGLVLVPERLVLRDVRGVAVLDGELRTIQRLRAGAKGDVPAIAATDTGILSVTVNDRTTWYAGTPLRQVEPPPVKPIPGSSEIVSMLDGSWEVLRRGNTLVEARAGAPPRTFADLSWLFQLCEGHELCEVDESATHYQTVLGKRNRILISSVGSRVPVTNSFGIMPYFRVEVFDLDTGGEVYREEELFRAKDRVAVLSPDGDVVVVSDGYTAVVHRLR